MVVDSGTFIVKVIVVILVGLAMWLKSIVAKVFIHFVYYIYYMLITNKTSLLVYLCHGQTWQETINDMNC